MRVVLVSGLSGAGKSTALRTFEDIGFEAIDNVPLRMVSAMCSDNINQDIAIGLDVRSRGFSAEMLSELVESLRLRDDIELELLVMVADSATLVRRFSETRRRHPLAQDRPVEDGIAHESDLIKPILSLASNVIDTTNLNSGDLKQALIQRYGAGSGFTVSVVSFSYARGLPREADLVFDVRFLRNPHYVDALRPLTGTDAAVAEYVKEDGDYAAFMARLQDMIGALLPRYNAEGKSYLTIAIGCTGGRHRSVCVAEEISKWLRDKSYISISRHRDI